MRWFRVSIGSILVMIAVCGVGFAALKHPSAWWSGGLLLGDLCLFVFALMAIAYRRGGRRAFWAGFALFGWVYLILGFAPGVREIARPYMLTTKALQKVWPEERVFSFTYALTPPATLNTWVSPVPVPGSAPTMGMALSTAANPATSTITTTGPSTPSTVAGAVPAALAAPAAIVSAPPVPSPAPIPTAPLPAPSAPPATNAAAVTALVAVNGGSAAQTLQWVLASALNGGPDPDEFHRVGHALWALLLAIVGGAIARLLYVSRQDQSTHQEVET